MQESLTIRLFGIKNDIDRKGFEIKVEKASNTKCDPVKTLNITFDEQLIQETMIKQSYIERPIFVKATHPHDRISRVVSQTFPVVFY